MPRAMRDACLYALALAAATGAAQAQTTPAPKPTAPANTVETVVVTSAAPEVQTSIDRRSYSLGKDIAATSGSIADALRNVPSLQVDLQGALTLRGDGNVTILVDGKPSAAFEGSGRADALQQLPADQYERIEVITNPSAAMNPEGSGGVINLVSKKSRGAGTTGATYVTAGTAGLKRAGGSFGYNSAKLAVTGSLAGNYQRNKSVFDDQRDALDPASGLFEDHDVFIIGRNLARSVTGRLNTTYTVDPKTQLTGGLNFNQLLIYGYPFNRFTDENVAGAVESLTERVGHRRFIETDTGGSAGWRRSFSGEGHQLSVDVLQNLSRLSDVNLWTPLRATPPTGAPLELNLNGFSTRHSELKVAYARPMGESAKLSLGYELKGDDNRYDAGVARGVTTAGLTPDPRAAYYFLFGQTINAGYATYERTIGDLNLQAGLRVENASLDMNETVTRLRTISDYTRAYPSLHLVWKLDDESKLTGAYSKRIQRPPAFLLNPFKIYIDPKTYQQGNPDLAPQETQSFEVAYEKRHGKTYYLATLYYRDNKDEFSPIARGLGDGQFLITFDNLGSSRSAGLELSANGALGKSVTYTVNSNLFRNQIDSTNLGEGERSGVGLGGQASLNWQAKPNDMLQMNAVAQGKRLYAQGVQQPNFTLNLGWRHKLDDRLTLTASVQDALNTSRFRRTLSTATLEDRNFGRVVSQAVSIRLDYRLGGKSGAPARTPGFDYENAAPPSP